MIKNLNSKVMYHYSTKQDNGDDKDHKEISSREMETEVLYAVDEVLL